MMLFLLGAAFAQTPEISAKPEPRPPVEGQCTETTSVVDPCSAVAIPTSEAADMLDIEIWGDQIYKHYQTDLQTWKLQEAELLRQNQKLKKTVWIRAAEGLLIGTAVGMVAAYAIER